MHVLNNVHTHVLCLFLKMNRHVILANTWLLGYRKLQCTTTMDWNLGHPEKHAIITHLLKFRIPSKYIVPIDSILVASIYGQHARKSARHRHDVQQLAFDISLDPDSRQLIHTAFENYKDQLDINSAPTYFKTATDIAKLIYNGVEMVRSIGDQSYETVLW
jgi:hypothetical protein